MKPLFYFVSLLIFCSNAFGQKGFRYTYPDNLRFERNEQALSASDSCFVAIGSVDEFIRTDTLINDCVDCPLPYDTIIYDIITPDILVVKTDRKGDTLWTRRIGAEGMDQGFAISETLDMGFILGGIDSTYYGRVIKLDKAGLNIADLTGKTVFTKSLYEKLNQLDISDLINGVYIVKLNILNKTYINKLIINGR